MREETEAPTTLSALVEAYCREVVLSPGSIRNYRITARVFKRDTGVDELSKIDKNLVIAWRDTVLQRVTVVTWNSYLTYLRIAFSFAVRSGWIEHNPFQYVKQLGAWKKRKKTVPDEVTRRAIRLLQEPDEPIKPGWFWVIVVRLLFFTGMRARQLTALRWNHIDFTHKTMLLAVEGSKTKREWIIPIPPDCVDDLLYLRNRTLRVNPSAVTLRHQVFRIQLFNRDDKGQELTTDQVSGFFRHLSETLGARITSRRLRHTMATKLAQGQQPYLKSLQFLLGHTCLRTTLEYVEPEMGQLRSVLSRLRLD
ncbi:tyrosine-type recombinase/integrase [Methylocaldum sp. GT1BB]|uniref:tyrosine-type recombinase/integrase n=1 Tax=Methylocaldum sp. GT1BB TaxID=3438963 RepID=UPI003DA0C0C9